MARRPYAVTTYQDKGKTAGWDCCLTVEADLVTAEEVRSAPGVKIARRVDRADHNPALATYLIVLDPLYDETQEALDNFEEWLSGRETSLDLSIWNQ